MGPVRFLSIESRERGGRLPKLRAFLSSRRGREEKRGGGRGRG